MIMFSRNKKKGNTLNNPDSTNNDSRLPEIDKNSKIRVKYLDFLTFLNFKSTINLADLHNLELYDFNGNKVEITEEQIKDWKFIGLSNIDFIKTIFGLC